VVGRPAGAKGWRQGEERHAGRDGKESLFFFGSSIHENAEKASTRGKAATAGAAAAGESGKGGPALSCL